MHCVNTIVYDCNSHSAPWTISKYHGITISLRSSTTVVVYEIPLLCEDWHPVLKPLAQLPHEYKTSLTEMGAGLKTYSPKVLDGGRHANFVPWMRPFVS